MPIPNTPGDRIDALAHNLHVATGLIGPDVGDAQAVHSEYIRALSEQTCVSSGISTDHKDAVTSLFISILGND